MSRVASPSDPHAGRSSAKRAVRARRLRRHQAHPGGRMDHARRSLDRLDLRSDRCACPFDPFRLLGARPDDQRARKLGAVLRYLERRINAMLDSCEPLPSPATVSSATQPEPARSSTAEGQPIDVMTEIEQDLFAACPETAKRRPEQRPHRDGDPSRDRRRANAAVRAQRSVRRAHGHVGRGAYRAVHVMPLRPPAVMPPADRTAPDRHCRRRAPRPRPCPSRRSCRQAAPRAQPPRPARPRA